MLSIPGISENAISGRAKDVIKSNLTYQKDSIVLTLRPVEMKQLGGTLAMLLDSATVVIDILTLTRSENGNGLESSLEKRRLYFLKD